MNDNPSLKLDSFLTQNGSSPPKATWLLSGQVKEDEPVRTVRIETSPFIVGRRVGLSLTISKPSVSSQHAELALHDGRLVVRDLESTNGTFVNGVRIVHPCQLKHGDLVQFAQTVFRVGLESEHRQTKTAQDDAADRALALIQFDKLITERAVVPHVQPIVEINSQETVGYEILGRSRLFGLASPEAMFTAAAVLDLEAELSRILRYEGILHSCHLPGNPLLFVNTHPSEMAEPGLLEFSLRELRELAPDTQIVLEIHERAVAVIAQMRELQAALASMNILLAYDDFGAGQARLVELVEVPPAYLKFDLKLVHNIHHATQERQRMLASLVQMVRELGIFALAEGVETQEEHQVCQQMGFQFAQGFFFGRPALPKDYLSGHALGHPATES
jgi:EAL domain-containing protein (putative c-di-GMP-specific phosphodiesterase class I)